MSLQDGPGTRTPSLPPFPRQGATPGHWAWPCLKKETFVDRVPHSDLPRGLTAWLFNGQEAALLSPFLKQPQQTLPELPSESLHFHHTDDWLRTYCALHPSNNLEPSEQTLGADAILIPILQMRKVRHKRADTLPKVM